MLSGFRFTGGRVNVVGVELDDGTLLIPSQDFEGNGPGVLFQLAGNKIYAHTMARKGPTA